MMTGSVTRITIALAFVYLLVWLAGSNDWCLEDTLTYLGDPVEGAAAPGDTKALTLAMLSFGVTPYSTARS